MSHRRGGGGTKPEGGSSVIATMEEEKKRTAAEEKVPFGQSLGPVESGSLKLDEGPPSSAAAPESMAPLSIEERYKEEKLTAKRKHWMESPFAVGLVEPTWKDEEGAQCTPRTAAREWTRGEEISPDSSGCLCCSGLVCSRLGAGRVGNMAVLWQKTEWVEEVELDEETGERTTRRFTRPRLLCLMGPYWPMLLFVTYPLILGVSIWTFHSVLSKSSSYLLLFAWFICTFGLITALGLTAFRDPGILYRTSRPPPQEEGIWRWNDTAQTFRPRGAFYDPDCAVVVQDFDHT
mmetsp:Transcript_18824/g.43787  ORF Transcript_18824/g.43787 Transcript_18824/m.43787 type:complete len:291 (+) Transcript_18824:3-875(+)